MKRGKRLGKILSLRPIRLCNSETGKERRLPQIVGNKGKFHLLVESAEKYELDLVFSGRERGAHVAVGRGARLGSSLLPYLLS